MTEIHQLIDRYFEGETSREEELFLKRQFAEGNVPEDVKHLMPLFVFLHDEAIATQVLSEVKQTEPVRPRRFVLPLRTMMIAITSVAAAIALIVMVQGGWQTNRMASQNYAWVNGERITNSDKVWEYAQEAFAEVQTEPNVVDQQLSGFFD